MWLATGSLLAHSFVEDAGLGLILQAPCLPALLFRARLSASSRGRGLYTAG